MVKEKKRDLEMEKRNCDEKWNEVMKDAEEGIFDRQKIVAAMDLIIMWKQEFIRKGRRDLLD